jgi:hypothetical protein
LTSKIAIAVAAFACIVALGSCQRRDEPQPAIAVPSVIDTQWTRSAAERAERLTAAALKQDPRRGGAKYALPRLRVYDAKGQLVYSLDPTLGWNSNTIGGEIERAIASGRPISGPSLNDTLAELQTADGRSASAVVAPGRTALVFDYWASWCVPCKILGKALVQWQSSQPRGAVRIVKAEADPTKFARERGEKVLMEKRGLDGKLHQVELN